MASKSRVVWLAGFMALLAFTAFSYLIRETEAVWVQTRAMGLLAYVLLFAAIVMGEWRLLTKCYSEFGLFRHHARISVLAVLVVLTHFVSAFVDRYKWGKQLTFAQYLGFSFSDKWLALLSLGVLSFYIMVLVGLTSSSKRIVSLGFRRWKAVHYLSYVAFFFAYVHAVNLGTDLKTSMLAPVLSPLIALSFMLVMGLLSARILKGLNLLSDQTEVNLAAAFFILLLLFSGLLASAVVKEQERISALASGISMSEEYARLQEQNIRSLQNETLAASKRLAEVRYGKTA